MAVPRSLDSAGLRPPTADEILGLARQLGLTSAPTGLTGPSFASDPFAAALAAQGISDPPVPPTPSGVGGGGPLAVRAILNALVAAPPVGSLKARANAGPSLLPATSTGMAGLPSAAPPFAAAGLTTSTGLADGTARPAPSRAAPRTPPRTPPARRPASTAPSDPAPVDPLHARLLNAEAALRAYRRTGGKTPKGFPLPLAQYQNDYARIRRAILGNPVDPSLPVGGNALPGLGTSTGLPNRPPSTPSLSLGAGPTTSTAGSSLKPLPGPAWSPPDDGLASIRAYNTPARLAAISRAMNPGTGGSAPPDPWARAPFTRESFEWGRDHGWPVLDRNGNPFPLDRAIRLVSGLFPRGGYDPTRNTRSPERMEAQGNGETRDMVGQFGSNPHRGESMGSYAARWADAPLRTLSDLSGVSEEDLLANAPLASGLARTLGGVLAAPTTNLGLLEEATRDPWGAAGDAGGMALDMGKTLARTGVRLSPFGGVLPKAARDAIGLRDDAPGGDVVADGLNTLLLGAGALHGAKAVGDWAREGGLSPVARGFVGDGEGIAGRYLRGVDETLAGKRAAEAAQAARPTVPLGSRPRAAFVSALDDSVRRGTATPERARATLLFNDRVAKDWAGRSGATVDDYYRLHAPETTFDQAVPQGALNQVEGLISGKENVPVLAGTGVTQQAAEWVHSFAEKNPVLKNWSDLSDEKIVRTLVDHVTKEIQAWRTLPNKGRDFYSYDIGQLANPELNRWANEIYDRDLTPAEVQLYHLVSALGSPARAPLQESAAGFKMFERYLRTGELSERGNTPSTEWKTETIDGKTKRSRTDQTRYDANGDVIYSRWSNRYDSRALDKIRALIDKRGLDGAMEWLGSKHSWQDLVDEVGMNPNRNEHEYLSREGDENFGIFGVTGPKLGSYSLNRWGEFGTITKDQWYARTMARLFGESLLTKAGKAIERPWDPRGSGLRKRRLADEAFARAGVPFGMSPADVQSAMWDLEQTLYGKLGVPREASYVSEGLRRGIDDVKAGNQFRALVESPSWHDPADGRGGASAGERPSNGNGLGPSSSGRGYAEGAGGVDGASYVPEGLRRGIDDVKAGNEFGVLVQDHGRQGTGLSRGDAATYERGSGKDGTAPSSSGRGYAEGGVDDASYVSEGLRRGIDDVKAGNQFRALVESPSWHDPADGRGGASAGERPSNGNGLGPSSSGRGYVEGAGGLGEPSTDVSDGLKRGIQAVEERNQPRETLEEIRRRTSTDAGGDSSAGQRGLGGDGGEAPGSSPRGSLQTGTGGVVKGGILFRPGMRPLIHLFTGVSDVTTLVHELAHGWRQTLAPSDAQKLAGHFGPVGSRGYEEGFARAFERYLRNGKAPSAALAPTFRRFRGWMKEVYGPLKGSAIEAQVHPEVRAMFDRMLGGDERPLRPSASKAPGAWPLLAYPGATPSRPSDRRR